MALLTTFPFTKIYSSNFPLTLHIAIVRLLCKVIFSIKDVSKEDILVQKSKLERRSMLGMELIRYQHTEMSPLWLKTNHRISETHNSCIVASLILFRKKTSSWCMGCWVMFGIDLTSLMSSRFLLLICSSFNIILKRSIGILG